MRFLTKKEVLAITRLADASIARMEDAGKFPRRVPLGKVKPILFKKGTRAGSYKSWNCRVGWLDIEVAEWLVERLNARDSLPEGKSWTTERALALISAQLTAFANAEKSDNADAA